MLIPIQRYRQNPAPPHSPPLRPTPRTPRPLPLNPLHLNRTPSPHQSPLSDLNQSPTVIQALQPALLKPHPHARHPGPRISRPHPHLPAPRRNRAPQRRSHHPRQHSSKLPRRAQLHQHALRARDPLGPASPSRCPPPIPSQKARLRSCRSKPSRRPLRTFDHHLTGLCIRIFNRCLLIVASVHGRVLYLRAVSAQSRSPAAVFHWLGSPSFRPGSQSQNTEFGPRVGEPNRLPHCTRQRKRTWQCKYRWRTGRFWRDWRLRLEAGLVEEVDDGCVCLVGQRDWRVREGMRV